MAEFPALQLWTDAYLGDTTHLTTIEHGAYLLLLMAAWRSPDCKLPDDDKMLARYARLTPAQWARVKPIMLTFWQVKSSFWSQRRLTDEWVAVRQKRQQAADNGRLSALKRKGRHLAERDASDIASDQRNGNETSTTTATATASIKETPKGVSKKPAVRGSRLPADFAMPVEWKQWAADELGWSFGDIRDERLRFIDYWHAKPGKDGCKLDWLATWRNWCRGSRREAARKIAPELDTRPLL